MTFLYRLFPLYLCLLLTGYGHASVGDSEPLLPDWQVLEFEKQQFWATARSRIELPSPPEDQDYWVFEVESSVPRNSEHVSVDFDPVSGQVMRRERLSRGTEDKRLKSFVYLPDYILRERQNPSSDTEIQPVEWPVTSRKKIPYPPAAAEMVVTNPYLLILLAQRLQAQGPGASMEVLVHTDLNFYRVRLTCGNGIPVPVDYETAGSGRTTGTRDTIAVALLAIPEGKPAEDEDLRLMGLHGEIIFLFDQYSGIPLQVRGQAPRVGDTQINLKSITPRTPES